MDGGPSARHEVNRTRMRDFTIGAISARPRRLSLGYRRPRPCHVSRRRHTIAPRIIPTNLTLTALHIVLTGMLVTGLLEAPRFVKANAVKATASLRKPVDA